MALVGYGTIKEGDNLNYLFEQRAFVDSIIPANSPLIGHTYWIFKNSAGADDHNKGYLYVIFDDFSHLGFDMSNMGGGSFAIQGVPEGIAGLSSSKLVTDMLAGAMEKGGVSKEEVHRSMALTMARSAALVVGEVLSVVEMSGLVDELFACEVPGYTPDGKKTFVVVEDGEVEKMFR